MLKAMLLAAVALGYTITVAYDDDEVDYEGSDVNEAIEAIEACDEISVFISEEQEDGSLDVVGSALIVNDLDDDERIADCSGWVDSFISER